MHPALKRTKKGYFHDVHPPLKIFKKILHNKGLKFGKKYSKLNSLRNFIVINENKQSARNCSKSKFS